PVLASWRRYRRIPSTIVGAPAVISPIEEHEAFVELVGQAAVDEIYAGIREVQMQPDVGVSVRWVPNFKWRGQDAFTSVGLDEHCRHEGHLEGHHLMLSRGAPAEGEKNPWLFVGVAVPFGEIGDEFQTFLAEVQRRGGLTLDPGRWFL